MTTDRSVGSPRKAEQSGPQATAFQNQSRLVVLIPVFNDQTGLERSLTSLAQDPATFDVFVIDDGSELPIEIPPHLPYEVRLIRQSPNAGITAALNNGLRSIATAGYEYVARLDAGDLNIGGRLTAQTEFLDEHPSHAAVGTAIRCVDTSGRLLFEFYPPTGHCRLMRFFRYRQGLVHPSAMIRMEALLASGFYRDRFPGGEDYDLFLRLGKTYRLANLSSIFLIKEISPRSITAKRLSLRLCRLRILASHFDSSSIHSYLGILTNVWLLLAPQILVHKIRKLCGYAHVSRTP